MYNKQIKSAILMFCACVGFAVSAAAQAVLPTSFGFDTATPTGWTQNLGNNGNLTYGGGPSGLAARLDATGENVVLFFAEEPGALTYYIKGSVGAGNTTWSGTFTVEESANGTTYTPLRTFNSGGLDVSVYNLFTDTPQPTTRYIRWFFTNKISGSNVALDEINLAQPTAGPAAEINVQQAGGNIPSGGTFSIGNSASTIFTLQNLGLVNTLNIASIDLGGANATEFSLGTAPTTVAAQSNETFTLNFAPVGTGTRTCTLTISNDDASEGTYVINIIAIAGSVATEPTAQSGPFTFTGVRSWDFNVGFTAGSPVAEHYVVLRKKSAAVTEVPSDNETYVKGEWIGGAQVVYVGDAATFNARSVEASTTYHFAAFAFNGPEGFENYLTANPTIGQVSSQGPNIGSYYAGVNHNNASFVSDLTGALDPADYFQIFYSNYAATLVGEFYIKDTAIAGVPMNAVECQYSGDHYTYEGGFVWWNGQGEGRLSREHSFPQSWMPTYFDQGFDDSEEVSDLHNLFPVLQVECNAVRSNYPYGEVVNASSNYLGTSFGTNAANQQVYEMRESFKGNAARAMMYQAVKNNAPGQDFSFPEQISLIVPYGQDERVIKNWHFGDLPDNAEIARNEYIEFKQNNRNGFIDSIYFPCFIRFSTLTKWEPVVTYNNQVLSSFDSGLSYQWYLDGTAIPGATSQTYAPTDNGNYTVAVQQFSECPVITSQATSVIDVSVSEINQVKVSTAIYPNPNKGAFFLTVNTPQRLDAQVRITDVSGKLVYTRNQTLNSGDNRITLELELPAGVYMTQVMSELGNTTTRMVVE